jgi:hypothetical protein
MDATAVKPASGNDVLVGAGPPMPYGGMPVARPVSKPQVTVAAPAPPPPLDLIQVQCPAGKYAGDEITVSTPSGRRCRVTVPNVAPGTTFLVRLPADGASSIANALLPTRQQLLSVRQEEQVLMQLQPMAPDEQCPLHMLWE